MKKILIFIMLFAINIFASHNSTFTQQISKGDIIEIEKIPKGIKTLTVSLESNRDLDIQLYGENDNAIVAYQGGLLNKGSKSTLDKNGIHIVYSGYNGTNNKSGHEYIKITGTSTEAFTVKVYGFQAGKANVKITYSLDNHGGTTGCTKEYAPVCGDNNYCPPGSICLAVVIPNTFNNMCLLKEANATFMYDGKCKDDTNSKDIQKSELEKNIKLWDKSGHNSNYQFSVDAFFSYEPAKWTTIVKEGNATILSGDSKIGGAKTIDGHFKFIQSLIDNDKITLTKVTYNAKYGYPTEIKWGASNPNILGLWGSYKIYDFKILDTVCTALYEPVCGVNYLLECPKNNPTCKLKNFGNMCNLNNNPNFEFLYEGECNTTQSYEKIITIKSKKVNCIGFMAPGSKCLQIQEEDSKIWETVSGIKGLNYQEHYKYNILAKVTKSDPNLIDAPHKFYELIKILKKDSVENNDTICTKEYVPVCGITNPCPPGAQCFVPHIYKTFGNMCELKAVKAKFVYAGQCKEDTNTSVVPKNCLAWYDGCNHCFKIGNSDNEACTKMACTIYGDFKCTKWK